MVLERSGGGNVAARSQGRDDGGRASGMAVGLDFRGILEIELASFDKGDKMLVSTLENRVGEVFMFYLLNYFVKTLIKALAG